MAILNTLSYDVDKLFKLVQVKSLYAAGAVRSQAGDTQERHLALTDNERDFYEIELKTACDNVYTFLSMYCKDVENPYEYNKINSSTNKRYTVYQVSMPDTYDNNKTRPLYNSIEQYIVNYILFEWFKTINVLSIAQSFELVYIKSKDGITNIIHSRKTLIERPYRTL